MARITKSGYFYDVNYTRYGGFKGRESFESLANARRFAKKIEKDIRWEKINKKLKKDFWK
jgi:hypothetical protein